MKHDVVVIGAGPAGLSFAREIADTSLNVTLLEKSPESTLNDPPYDGREIALTHFSRRLLDNLGMWELFGEDGVSLIKDAKVLNGNSSYALSFTHEEAGEENLGYLVSNRDIRKAAYRSIAGYDNIQILNEKEVSALGTDDQKGWVTLSDGERLEAPLIVAADSRFSTTRRMMGIATPMLDFGRTCIVCTMSCELPHDDTAYEYFHFGRTLAVLPMNNNQVSIVITLKSQESAEVLSQSDASFASDIERRIKGRLGAMKLSSKLFPYPLVATLANKFCANRFAIIGDAAIGMHPVTAHGFNLGLRGAHTLASEIKTALSSGRDYASRAVLERYSNKHRRIGAPIYHGTNALVGLYTDERLPAKIARRALLRLGNRIKPAKRLIMNQLTESRLA